MKRNDFADWLLSEIQSRGWSQNQLAIRSGLSRTAINDVINRKAYPGPDLCRALARALGYPQEFVFRKAGLLDDPPPPDYDPEAQLLLHWFQALPPQERQEILEYVQFKLSRRQPHPAPKRRSRAQNPAPGD